MGLVLIDPASAWPVTLDEAKAQCFATDTTGFDTLLTRLIKAATAWAQNYTGRTLAVQTWKLVLDEWPAEAIELPRGPVTGVTSVKYFDTAGVQQTLDAGDYVLDLTSDPQWIVLAEDASWPDLLDGVNGIEVEFTAGYAANVPEDLRQAILMLVGFWFASRESVNVGNIVNEVPFGTRMLLDPYRKMVL